MSELNEDQDILDDEGFAEEIIAAAQGGILVSQPATVLSYDSETQTAVVQPVVRVYNVLWESEVEGFEPLASATVPVVFPGGGTFSITWPIEAGSQGLLVFSERSTAAWMASGGTDVEPADRALFNEANGFFIPELRSAATPRPSDAVDDDHVVMKMVPDQRLLVASATANKALAIAEGVLSRFNALETAFNLHTHTVPPLGLSASAGPVPVTGATIVGTTGTGPTAGTTSLPDLATARIFVDS